MLGDAVERELRLLAGVGVEEAERGEALEVGEADGVLRQEHDRLGGEAGIVGARHCELAADDRLDTLADAVLAEFQRAEQVPGVGDRHRRHLRLAGEGGEFVHLDGALAERIGGMDAEVDEIGVGHAAL